MGQFAVSGTSAEDPDLRHQLVASPAHLKKHKTPRTPQDLFGHRLLAFSYWNPENSWSFAHANGKDKETLTFDPHLSMNDYVGFAHALLAGAGIGEVLTIWAVPSDPWRTTRRSKRRRRSSAITESCRRRL